MSHCKALDRTDFSECRAEGVLACTSLSVCTALGGVCVDVQNVQLHACLRIYILYASVCRHTSLFTSGCVGWSAEGEGSLSCGWQVSTRLCVGVCVGVWVCDWGLCRRLKVHRQVSACEGVGGSVGANARNRRTCIVYWRVSLDYWHWIVYLYLCTCIHISVSTYTRAFTICQSLWGQAGVKLWYNPYWAKGRKDHHPVFLFSVLKRLLPSMLCPQFFAILLGLSKDGIALCVCGCVWLNIFESMVTELWLCQTLRRMLTLA